MKFKSLFAILLAISLLFCTFVVPTSAKTNEANSEIEIIIENTEISEETRERIEKYYSTENHSDEGATTYGLTCTLLGHKIESTTVTTITHKVRATAPRCLKKIYDYEACTRCDYEASDLITSSYIFCCA